MALNLPYARKISDQAMSTNAIPHERLITLRMLCERGSSRAPVIMKKIGTQTRETLS